MSIFFKCFRSSSPKGPASTRRLRRGGFTLIELLVVSIIIIIITTFILFRQQGFNSATLLRSLSYSVALTMRQAQTYGVSVRGSSGNTIFAQGYGVYFSSGDMFHYYLFADANGNGQYDVGEELPIFTIGNGKGTDYYLSNFCAHTVAGDQCVSGTSPAITSATLYFRRPAPDGCFATSQNPSVCSPGGAPVYTYAYVQLRSTGGTDVRTVKVTTTGQISVCALNAVPANC